MFVRLYHIVTKEWRLDSTFVNLIIFPCEMKALEIELHKENATVVTCLLQDWTFRSFFLKSA